jgi:hypothetical protein
MNYYSVSTLLLPIMMASCQLSTPTKQIPVVGQIATGVNAVGGRDDLNETSSLFAPRNFKKQWYQVPAGLPILDASGNETGKYHEGEKSYSEVVGLVRGRTPQEGEFILDCASRIDENYHEWLEDYIRGRASLNTSLDILAQGLSAAGAMFTPASTVRVLSGTSTFVQGANATIESKFFLSLTALQQVPVMGKQRKEVRAQLNESDSEFQKELGLLDEYYMAGTLFTAFGAGKEED